MTDQADRMIARTRRASREIASLNLRIAALEQNLDTLRTTRDTILEHDTNPNQEGTTP